MSAALVQNVGSVSGSNSLTSVITVPAGGVAAGDTLLVRLYVPSASITLSSVTDSKGNAYTIRQGPLATPGGAVRYYEATCVVGTALVSGDTITATASAKTGVRMVVDEFSGLLSPTGTDGFTDLTGTSLTPGSGAITPTVVGGVVLGALCRDAVSTVTEDTDSNGGDTWHTLTTIAALSGAYKIPTSNVAQAYDPTIGSSIGWLSAIAAFKPVVKSLVFDTRSRRQTLTRR